MGLNSSNNTANYGWAILLI